MPPYHDSRLCEIDGQILRLFHDRVAASSELTDAGSPALPEDEAEMLSYWLEEAADLELDETQVEKICRLVLQLCKDERE